MNIFVSLVALLIKDVLGFAILSCAAYFSLILTALACASKHSALARIFIVGAKFIKPSGVAV